MLRRRPQGTADAESWISYARALAAGCLPIADSEVGYDPDNDTSMRAVVSGPTWESPDGAPGPSIERMEAGQRKRALIREMPPAELRERLEATLREGSGPAPAWMYRNAIDAIDAAEDGRPFRPYSGGRR